ncbi:hypothetical protein SAVCW2_12850 [Streptomyces avermitilis]|uniref:Uncharacterized protein n=1 Tax=Streptomyces avermitilis TaxID=33903 RepID=A0A4D4MP78_STRAX|nr:hypothetical protein SAVMC3_74120 [Streptomyces avermitilis]GDY72977.1 hypothetical protein SAV31267_024620 [Streptomyces avermitilis]GDY82086.1 hypothetical protein SAVCW2_12850 [Streptomyces avermitilis]
MRGTGGSLGMRCVAMPGGSRLTGSGVPGLTKKTTGDLWPESRPEANGIEPTGAQREAVCGMRYSTPTSRGLKEVGSVRWVTDHQTGRSTNPEIGE